MSTWTDLLDTYEHTLERAEASLEAGVFPTDGWDGDELVHPNVDPTAAEIQRYQLLAVRADEIEARVEDARLAVLEELGTMRRRRQAARGYARNAPHEVD